MDIDTEPPAMLDASSSSQTETRPPRASRPGWPAQAALVLVVLAIAFCRASNCPIWHLDTWAHWKYGQWIWEHGRLPERDPFSPYSDPKKPLVDHWWLSQVACYRVYAAAGMEGIALFYGLVELAKSALYLAAFRRVAGSLRLAVLGLVLMEGVRWTFFGVFRPQVLGEVCWAALLLACARPPLSRAALVWVPLGVGLWANLHGSFLLAFVWLAVHLAGRLLDRARSAPGLAAALADRDVRCLALVLVLSLAAACVNPYGPKLLWEMARFGNDPILRYVHEWQPLVPLTTLGGQLLLASMLLLVATFWLSPRRFTPTELVFLMLFGVPVWFAVRMQFWWAPVWVYVLLPHWRAMLEQWGLRSSEAGGPVPTARSPRRGVGLLVVAGSVAVTLLLSSGTGRWLRRQEPRPAEDQLSAATPVQLVNRLKGWMAGPACPTALRIYCPPIWSDYLLWELPPFARLYWYSHWNVFSPQLFEDSRRLLQMETGPDGWRTVVERYRLNAVILAAEEPLDPLFEYLWAEARRPESEWWILYKGVSENESGTLKPSSLVAVRRVDPFVLGLANAQVVQGGLGGLGLTPLASQWSFLTHLPWSWAAQDWE
jgi:hypothetical protein